MRFRVFVIGLLVCGSAISQSIPPGITLHRTNAGKLDASGWTVATSAGGNFTVLLPCLYQDYSATEHDQRYPVTEVYTLGCKYHGLTILASRLSYREASDAPHLFSVQAQHSTVIKFRGNKAIKKAMSSASSCGAGLIVLDSPYMFVLSVDGPKSSCTFVQRVKDKFLGSLVINKS